MRILNNSHIASVGETLKHKLSMCQTEKDYLNITHLDDESKYDCDGDSKDFSEKEIDELTTGEKINITIFEQDKLQDLAKQFEENENE